MANKLIPFIANVVNGKILEFPKTFYITCKGFRISGQKIFRDFNEQNCIIAMSAFAINYDNMELANKDFTQTSFMQYWSNQCQCCPDSECHLVVNGCALQVNGCNLRADSRTHLIV